MLIFCCIWSSSLCTLALHIAGSLWRLDFNHSSLFRPPSSLRLPPLVHPIYMRKCLWSIYLSPHPAPLVFHSRANRCDSDNIFPVRYSPCGSHHGIAQVERFTRASCELRPSSAHVASPKGSFFSLVKPVNFAAPRGRRNDQSAVPKGPKEI